MDIIDELRAVPHIMGEASLCYRAAQEIERLRSSLSLIRSFGGKTLLGPAHDTERLHQIGAAVAFEQAADIARTALEQPTS